MSKFEKYKPSDIEWIGDVPFDWKVKRIKDFFAILGGNGFPDTEQGNETGDIPFLKVSDINSANYEVSTSSNYVDNETVLKKGWNVIPINSIIMGKIGEALKKNHRKINTVNCLIDNNMMALQPLSKVNTKFAYYVLSIVDMDWHTNPGTIPAVSTVALKSSKITVPKEAVQQTIANYLDDQTQKIDRLIANKKAQAEKLKELRQIEINNAVTKGLNPNAEMKDSGIDWLGKIPKHWRVKRLKNYFYIKGRIGWQELKADEFQDTGAYCVTGTDFNDGKVNWETCYRVSYERWQIDDNITLCENDLLITKDGTIGKVAIVKSMPEKSTLNSGIFLLRPLRKSISNDFFYWVLISNCLTQFNDYTKTGSTINHLYQNVFVDFEFNLPPIKEQIEIANYLQESIKNIDKLINNIDAQIEKLQELRKIKIYEAVTGKIKVNAYVEATA
jgi:type I restriction enzyme S subunit